MRHVLKTSAILASLVGLAVAGCNVPETETTTETTQETTSETTTVVFVCPAGETIEASFANPDEAVVTLPGQAAQTLPIAESASGARYSDGTTTFWNKGNTALVEVNGEVVLQDCVAQE